MAKQYFQEESEEDQIHSIDIVEFGLTIDMRMNRDIPG